MMKKLMVFLFFLGLISTGQAQEAIEMNPVNVKSSSFLMELDEATHSLKFTIPEKQTGAFHANPLKFAESNFDIQQLINDNDAKYDSYQAIFKSSKGKLIVNYDKNGEIKSTFQNFKNVPLPYETGLSIYRDYRDYDIVRNKYVAASRNGKIQREFYKIKLQNGKKSKSLKLKVDRDKSMLGLALK
ncbi:MAG TPA: hypothetical protein VFI78_02220 [Salinimicrobium sp.]|nr:hypothetical protein [Salinimicrobium sp.]